MFLRLLCSDKSNSEIGEVLDIRLATVKKPCEPYFSKARSEQKK